MTKLKLMTVLGTRPEIIRLSAVIPCADRYFEHILVHTGQNYDYTLNKIFFDDLGLRAPDYYLESVGKDLGEVAHRVGGLRASSPCWPHRQRSRYCAASVATSTESSETATMTSAK